MSDTIERELPRAQDLTVDKLVQALAQQMFEADNDESTLYMELETKDGIKTQLELKFIILAINGVRTRAGIEEAKNNGAD